MNLQLQTWLWWVWTPLDQQTNGLQCQLSMHFSIKTRGDYWVQIYALEKQKDSTKLSKKAILELKASEFNLFSKIRLRFRLILCDEATAEEAVAKLTAAGDALYARSVFRGSPNAAAKQLIATVRKGAVIARRKRNKRTRTTTYTTRTGNTIAVKHKRKRGKNTCFQCGATGKSFHRFESCPSWIAKKQPSKGTKIYKTEKQFQNHEPMWRTGPLQNLPQQDYQWLSWTAPWHQTSPSNKGRTSSTQRPRLRWVKHGRTFTVSSRAVVFLCLARTRWSYCWKRYKPEK